MDTNTLLFAILTIGLVGVTDLANNPLLNLLRRHMRVTETPAVISPGVTFGLIAGGVLASQWKTHGQTAVAELT